MTNKKARVAQKSFPAKKRNEHLLSPADIEAMPNNGVSVPPPALGFVSKGKTYVIRTEGKANSFGIGKVVSPGVTSFAPGFYGLTREQLEIALQAIRKPDAQTSVDQLVKRAFVKLFPDLAALISFATGGFSDRALAGRR